MKKKKRSNFHGGYYSTTEEDQSRSRPRRRYIYMEVCYCWSQSDYSQRVICDSEQLFTARQRKATSPERSGISIYPFPSWMPPFFQPTNQQTTTRPQPHCLLERDTALPAAITCEMWNDRCNNWSDHKKLGGAVGLAKQGASHKPRHPTLHALLFYHRETEHEWIFRELQGGKGYIFGFNPGYRLYGSENIFGRHILIQTPILKRVLNVISWTTDLYHGSSTPTQIFYIELTLEIVHEWSLFLFRHPPRVPGLESRDSNGLHHDGRADDATCKCASWMQVWKS